MKKYVVREKELRNIVLGESTNFKFPVIMEEITLPDSQPYYLPSVLNVTTYSKYKNKPISSAKNINSTICQFMNFVKEAVDDGEDEAFLRLKEDKISGLNFYHISEFLNYHIKALHWSLSTVQQYEKRLFEFYNKLVQLKVINVKWEYKMVINPKTKKREKFILSPFDNIEYQVSYPRKYDNKIEKLVDLSWEHIQLFINLCKKYTPDITFGVILGIMGGLRQGEIVNLRFEDIYLYKDKNLMRANIKFRPELFEGRNLTASGVKRPRQQAILNMDGNLYNYYENHINYRMEKLLEKETNTSALFVDSKGRAMTGYTFMQRFKKLKTKFLEIIEHEDYTTWAKYNDFKWGTHICRGMFTNLCIKRGYTRTIEELRNLRGDNSNDSSQPYWNKFDIEVVAQNSSDVTTSLRKYENDILERGIKNDY